MVQQAQASRTISVMNPATSEVLSEVPVASEQEVQAAAMRARRAFTQWRQTSFHERAEHMYAARDWLVDHKDEIIETVVSETGKTRIEALLAEVLYCCDALGYFAKNAGRFLSDERRRPHLLKNKRVYVVYRPLGVVGIIAPWNYPFTLTFGEAVPALMAGNAVIIKPSEVTPLSGLLASKIYAQVGFPKDLVQTVCGYAETGQQVVDAVDAIAFTGSVATGKKVMAQAARALKPVLLELGGKDPMIVLKDADLDRAANACVYAGLSNSGQICMSVERVYVEEPVYEAFVQQVVTRVKRIRQGIDRNGESIDMGAMSRPEQLDIVEQHVRDAVAKGARVLTGGQRRSDLKGLFYEPTVLVDVDHTMTVMRDETFGPVIPIMKVKSFDEALALANDSVYGLTASIWTKNKRLGELLSREVEAGGVCVNDHLVNYLALEAPYGGMKASGIGRRHGEWGLRQFCQPQTIVVDRLGLRREPFWYPYDARMYRWASRLIRLLFRRGWRNKLFDGTQR